jgi:hypothetical protein
MKKLLWRIAMWHIEPSLKISFEEWDQRRTREQKERELLSIESEIRRLKSSVIRDFEDEIQSCGSLTIDDKGDYYEATERLEWFCRRKSQLTLELAQTH